jgi:hypothetical protein
LAVLAGALAVLAGLAGIDFFFTGAAVFFLAGAALLAVAGGALRAAFLAAGLDLVGIGGA